MTISKNYGTALDYTLFPITIIHFIMSVSKNINMIYYKHESMLINYS